MRIIATLFLLSAGFLGFAENETSEPDCPSTIREVFDALDRDLPEEEKEKLRKMKTDELIQLHMGFGMGIRNDFCLWKDTELTRKFRDCLMNHPDDMSGVIIDGYWRHVRGESIDPDQVLPDLKRTRTEEAKDWLARFQRGERPDGMTDEEANEAILMLEAKLSEISEPADSVNGGKLRD